MDIVLNSLDLSLSLADLVVAVLALFGGGYAGGRAAAVARLRVELRNVLRAQLSQLAVEIQRILDGVSNLLSIRRLDEPVPAEVESESRASVAKAAIKTRELRQSMLSSAAALPWTDRMIVYRVVLALDAAHAALDLSRLTEHARSLTVTEEAVQKFADVLDERADAAKYITWRLRASRLTGLRVKRKQLGVLAKGPWRLPVDWATAGDPAAT